MPAAASASRAGTTRPPTSASPTPSSMAERCASGARSPDAPTEPWAGIAGSTSRSSSASSVWITDQRMPE